MKRLLFLICLLSVVATGIAQERTVVLNSGNYIDLNVTKWYAYAGTTSDYLIPTTRDTIDFVLKVTRFEINFFN